MSSETVSLLPCPFCGSTDLSDQGPSYTQIMCNGCGAHEYDQPSREEAIAAWNLRSKPVASGVEDDDDRMQRISEVILHLQSIKERFGDTCVYIRRGGMSWGAVALNRLDDDKKNGVLDLQAKHDRDMEARSQQVERLIKEKRDLEARLSALTYSVEEPVAFQWRNTDRVMQHEGVWSYVDYHAGRKIQEYPEKYEVRPLFASPQPQPKAVTEEMVERSARAFAGIAFDDIFEGDAESEWHRVAKPMRAALQAALGGNDA